MKYLILILFLVPSIVFAQSTAKDKKVDSKASAKTEVKATKEAVKAETKTTKETTKAETKATKEAVKTEAKATKETPKTDPKPAKSAGASGVWVCGDSDVWHSNKDCSALKNCKQTVAESKGKAERLCKMCEKSNK